MSGKATTNGKSRSWSNVFGFSLVVLTLSAIGYAGALSQAAIGQRHYASAHRDNRALTMEIENLTGAQGRVVLEVVPGKQTDLDELGGQTVPAEVCIAQKPGGSCYIASAFDKNFAKNVKASVVELDENTVALLFQAEYWLVNDKLRLIAVLGANARGQIVNLLPPVVLSVQGQFRLWKDKEISGAWLMTTAEYSMTAQPPKETHFSRHYYTVSTYKWCPEEEHYVLVDQFRTKKRFPGYDAEDDPAAMVLDSVAVPVRRRVRQRQNVCAPQNESKDL